MNQAERVVYDALKRQHSLISRGQALQAGMTDKQIHGMVHSGRWEQVHAGVYRASNAEVTFDQRLLAACMAIRGPAVVSHLSAAWLWGLAEREPQRPHITVPPSMTPRLEGVTIHRLNDLDPSRTCHRRQIPCTDPLRTLVDVAATEPGTTTSGCVDRALASQLVTAEGIEAELERRARQGRRGVRPLRRVLIERGISGAPAASVLEAETVALLGRWDIPILGREVRHEADGRYRLDFTLAPAVAMEVDGYAYHWSPEAMSYDQRRRRSIRLAGVFLLVYTWRDIRFEERRVAGELKLALSAHAA